MQAKVLIEPDKLIETATTIRRRIDESFGSSGLLQLADAVLQSAREAVARGEQIRRPNWWLRAALVPLFAAAGSGLVIAYLQQTGGDPSPTWLTAFRFLDATKGSLAILAGALIFMVSLETRLKRRRVLQAVHELRAIAHVIDMHSVMKSVGQPMDLVDINRYLRHCIELLAVVGKIGQVYVQEFADPAALSAVDEFENLTTRLSSKIWQKLTTLDSSAPAGMRA